MIVTNERALNTNYENLVVSGCSFTSNFPAPDDAPFQWPNLIANWLGIKLYNLAIPGAGNGHISRSIRAFLNKNKLDPEKTLVLVMWSGIGRIDFMTSPELSNFKDQYPINYRYDKDVELVLGGNWFNSYFSGNVSPVIKMLIEYSKFQSDETFAMESFMQMQALTDFLNSRGYTNYQTSFVDYSNIKELKGDACIVNFWKTLEKLGLVLDTTNWLKLDPDQYFGNWARKYDTLQNDDFHPGQFAGENWARRVLLPLLIKNGTINYEE